ncbi:universal stress protein [Parvibaculum sp.]|uniref:universal stress protein n=1 Tax=Parvibaculum sp. TaxID=2024848 RepID=UPI00391C963C
MRSILFATDFSTRSDIALTRAAELAARFDAGLVLLHVVDDDQPASDVVTFANIAEERLDAMCRALPRPVRVRTCPLVARGDPFAVIAGVAEREQADLVVVGAHRRQTLRDVFTGTTAERVIRTGSRPVLMASSPAAGPHKGAVIGVDFSEGSRNAVNAARSLGLIEDLPIILVHGYRSVAKAQMQFVNIDSESIVKQVETDVSKLMSAVSAEMPEARLGRKPERIAIIDADPCTAIAQSVEATSADLVIIGARGLNAVERLLIGSVADAVLRKITCDVVVIPPAAASGK